MRDVNVRDLMPTYLGCPMLVGLDEVASWPFLVRAPDVIADNMQLDDK